MGRVLLIAMATSQDGYTAGQSVQSTSQGDAPPEYTMVFGIPIEEPEVAELVRKVLRISIVGVFFVIVSKVTKWLTFKSVAEDEDHHVTVADLVIGILIGYVPTKQARPAL